MKKTENKVVPHEHQGLVETIVTLIVTQRSRLRVTEKLVIGKQIKKMLDEYNKVNPIFTKSTITQEETLLGQSFIVDNDKDFYIHLYEKYEGLPVKDEEYDELYGKDRSDEFVEKDMKRRIKANEKEFNNKYGDQK